ncbi:MAG: hypothetical protein RL547_76 [Actinomycetota bacterium]
MPTAPRTRFISPLRSFLKAETAGAVLIVIAAIVALVWANSPWSGSYESLWDSRLAITVAGHSLDMDLHHWVNDGLMVLFFFVVGLEIKREFVSGHLSNRRAAALPVIGALGGVIMPALLFLVIAGRSYAEGWAIPVATDIALALGALSVVARSVPSGLRTFLLGLAIVDDIIGILIIAIAFSDDLQLWWLLGAVGAIAGIRVLQLMNVMSVAPYVIPGVVLWFSLHEAGIHATLAGVVVGLMTPMVPIRQGRYVDVEEVPEALNQPEVAASLGEGSVSVIEYLEHKLHPLSSFVVVPVFALANSGIELSAEQFENALTSSLTWAIVVGLVIGKPLGICMAVALARRTKLAEVPEGTSARHVVGVGSAAGIGFTVALFIAELAIDDADDLGVAKLAILVASAVSAVTSLAILRRRA